MDPLPVGWEWVIQDGGNHWWQHTPADDAGSVQTVRYGFLRHRLTTPHADWRVWYVRVMEGENPQEKIALTVARYQPTWDCLERGHTPETIPSTDLYSATPQPWAPCAECLK